MKLFNNKKILLIGKISTNPKEYTYSQSFYRALTDLGFAVDIFNCKNNYLPYKAAHADALPGPLKKINNLFINRYVSLKAIRLKPDIIFIIKGENLSFKTIQRLRKTTPVFLNFYPDNPFTLWNGNSSASLLCSLPLYDYFLIWSKTLIPILQAAGCNHPYYFPFAYDKHLFHQPLVITPTEEKDYDCDLLFIGTWDKEREHWLSLIISQFPSLRLHVWGNGWHEHLADRSILRSYIQGKAIYGSAMIKAFRCAKIVLNFIRKQNLDGHNMRTYECLASQAFMLTQHTTEQTTPPFQEGITLATFKDKQDLFEKITFYLSNKTVRDNIAQRGFLAVQQHTLHHHLLRMFKDIYQ